MSDEARETVAEAIAGVLRREAPAVLDVVPAEVWDELADAAIAVARPMIEREFLEQLIAAARFAEGWLRAHPTPAEVGEQAPFIGEWLRRFREEET